MSCNNKYFPNFLSRRDAKTQRSQSNYSKSFLYKFKNFIQTNVIIDEEKMFSNNISAILCAFASLRELFYKLLRLCVKYIFVIFAIFLLCGCSQKNDWVQFRGDGGRGVSSSRITPPLGLRWKIKLQESDEKIRSLNPPVVIGDTIYFGSDDGNFYALDVESGYMRWVFKSGAAIN
jgi:hypothetical protein